MLLESELLMSLQGHIALSSSLFSLKVRAQP